jgi:hypothetical protein
MESQAPSRRYLLIQFVNGGSIVGIPYPFKRCMAQFSIIGPGAKLDFDHQHRLHENGRFLPPDFRGRLTDSKTVESLFELGRGPLAEPRHNSTDIDQFAVLERTDQKAANPAPRHRRWFVSQDYKSLALDALYLDPLATAA